MHGTHVRYCGTPVPGGHVQHACGTRRVNVGDRVCEFVKRCPYTSMHKMLEFIVGPMDKVRPPDLRGIKCYPPPLPYSLPRNAFVLAAAPSRTKTPARVTLA
eukprot:1272241-Rhodomonas_salina.2